MDKIHSVAENFKVYKGSYVAMDKQRKVYPIRMRTMYNETIVSKYTGEYYDMNREFNPEDMKELYGIVIDFVDEKVKVLVIE